MKLPRMLVLIAGVAGIAALFLPLIEIDKTVDGKKIHFEISGYRVVSGVGSAREIASGDFQLTAEQDREIVDDLAKSIDPARTTYMVAFAPGVLLLLIGLAGRLGRGKGTIALIVGLAGAGIWLALKTGFDDAIAKDTSGGVAQAGLALTLLMVVGIGGTVGGLFALISPERKPAPSA